MEELQPEHTSGLWRLFIDSSKVRWKRALLRNGNKFPSVPLVFAVYTKVRYENLQAVLQIKYDTKNTSGIYVLTLRL
jgi:hypothetical protein